MASGRNLDNFPHCALVKVAADDKSIVEVDEYDDRGKIVARYKLDGKVFRKYEKVKGKRVETKEIKNPDELKPGKLANLGDIVAFRNVARKVSGHTGLNLCNVLFISAGNVTRGAGILSIQQHLDPNRWDQYNQVAFRTYK